MLFDAKDHCNEIEWLAHGPMDAAFRRLLIAILRALVAEIKALEEELSALKGQNYK